MQAKSVEGLSKIEVMGEFNPFRSLVSKLRRNAACCPSGPEVFTGMGRVGVWRPRQVGGGRWERELGENASQVT